MNTMQIPGYYPNTATPDQEKEAQAAVNQPVYGWIPFPPVQKAEAGAGNTAPQTPYAYAQDFQAQQAQAQQPVYQGAPNAPVAPPQPVYAGAPNVEKGEDASDS